MKILFLDDSQKRINEIKIPITWVKSAWTAIEALKRERWDLVCLDHDLDETYAIKKDDAGLIIGLRDGYKEDNGMKVVDWIEENKPNIKNIIVHSWNPPAADSMAKRLIKAGYNTIQFPFSILLADQLNNPSPLSPAPHEALKTNK